MPRRPACLVRQAHEYMGDARSRSGVYAHTHVYLPIYLHIYSIYAFSQESKMVDGIFHRCRYSEQAVVVLSWGPSQLAHPRRRHWKCRQVDRSPGPGGRSTHPERWNWSLGGYLGVLPRQVDRDKIQFHIPTSHPKIKRKKKALDSRRVTMTFFTTGAVLVLVLVLLLCSVGSVCRV